MKRVAPPGLLLMLAAVGTAGCALGGGFAGDARTLDYVSTIDALAPGQTIYRDCRTAPGQAAALFKDWALVHHHIAVRYWIVPTDGMASTRTVRINAHDCASPPAHAG